MAQQPKMDLVRRTLHMLGSGAKEYVSSTYGETLLEVKQQSTSVKNEILNDVVSTAQAGFNKFKQYAHVKNILDWFFDGSDQIEAEYSDDDEWDSGEPSMVDGDDTGDDDSPAVLDADSMKGISVRQTAAMYRIAGKQSEISIANTAELVKTADTRTAEIVRAIASVNTSLSALTNAFNTFTRAYFEGEEKKFSYYATSADGEKEKLEFHEPSGVMGPNGSRLGLEQIAKTIKERSTQSTVEGIKTLLGEIGDNTSSRIAWLIGNTFGEHVKIGGQSLNEIGKKFDNTVNAAVQGSLSSLLNADFFKRFIGDFTQSQIGADMRSYLKNNYNDERAVFDNMTRHTIIDIIPGYLRKITEGVTGKTWNIDERGQLTTLNENTFAKIAKNSFNATGIYGEDADTLLHEARNFDRSLTQTDIDIVLKAISISLVFSGKAFIDPRSVAADPVLISQVIVTLMNATGKGDSEYWTPIVRGVLLKMELEPILRQEFIEAVNSNIGATQRKSFMDVNKNPRIARDMEASGGILTIDMARDQLRQDRNRRVGYFDQSNIVPEHTEAEGSVTNANGNVVANIQRTNKFSDLTTLDYTRGIFTLLNRGINVRVDQSDKPYSYIRLQHQETGPGLESMNVSPHTEKLAEASGSFLKNLNEALMPRGLRLSMQHFAQDIGKRAGVYDETMKNENGNPVSLFTQFKDKIFSPFKTKVGKYGNQALDYIMGEKITETNDDGKEVFRREGGKFQPIRDRWNTIKDNITSDIKSIGDTYDRKMALRDAKAELKDTVAFVQRMDNTEGSSENDDRIAAQHVFALMQTAVADGDGSQDIGRINDAINNIQNPELRARLQRSVVPMVQATGEKIEKKSLIGKLLSGGLSLTKKIFSPIITVLKSGFALVKNIGSKILSLIGRGIKSGTRDIVSGASNLRRAFFGQSVMYDADGNVIEPETRGLFGNMKDAWTRRSDKKAREAYTKEVSGIVSPAIGSTGVDHEAERKKLEAAQKEADAKIKAAEEKATEAENKAQKMTIGQRISAWNPLTRIYENSEFLTGFTQAFRESKMKKEESRVKSLKTETVADRESEKLSKAVSGETKSVFTSILDAVHDILSFKQKEDAEVDEASSTTIPNDDGGGTATAKTDTEADQLKASEDEEKSKVKAASENGGTPVIQTTAATSASSTTSVEGNDDGGGTAKASSKFSVGQALGGITSMLGGIFKIIMTILMSVEGFKVLINFVKDAFVEAIQPLGKMFISLKKAITPIIKNLTGIVSTIATSLSSIVKCVIDLLTPVLESTSPVLEMIGEVLPGLLECVSILLKVIMAPLMGVMQAVIVPVLRQVANVLEVVMGTLQFAFGLVISALGGILRTVSLGFGKMGDKGDEMVNQGNEMMKTGAKSMWSGTKKFVTTAVEQMNPVSMTKTLVSETVNSVTSDGTDTEVDARSTRKNTPYDGSGGSVMDGVVASGDVNSHNTTSSKIYNTYNTYGSGDKLNQKSYGKYLNMNNRGCGPIALADVYTRRTGRSIDPAVLAKRMYGAGLYEPNRGTSVQGLIAAGQAMGMNTRVGRVTMDSVKRATPNNPITLIGSGSGYTTKSGNNHYVNVLGTKGGVSYIANPLTGRVDQAYTSSLVSGAKYGLYGSGDDDDTLSRFNLGDGFMSSFKDLTSTAAKILSIFSPEEKSTTDEVNEAIQAEQDKETTYQIKANMTDDEGYVQEDVDNKALELCKENNPQQTSESSQEYEKRIAKIMNTYGTKYQRSAVRLLYGEESNTNVSSIKDSVNASIEGGAKLIAGINESMVDTSDTNGGYFANPDNMQVRLATDGYTPTIMTTNISGNSSDQSPLHEFFKYTTGATFARSDNGNWYDRRNNPDQSGQGSSGGTHRGIDILTSNKNSGTATLYPTTDGIVTESKYSSTAGNMVAWKDSAGYIHRYLHMNSHPLVSVNQNIKGGMNGTLLGYIGNTGNSRGSHLHYDIREKLLSGNFVNPLTYFQYVRPAYVEGLQSRITIPSGLMNNTWNSYKNKDGVAEYFQATEQAGLTPAEAALIASVGIQEDSGRKIFGTKSLTGVTHDSNGQQAVGIMNWVDIDTKKYGVTVPDQLRYIKRKYFDDEWDSYQAKVRDPNASNQLPAFARVSGRDGFTLNVGDAYGNTINSDLIEGASHFISSALVPASYTSDKGLNQYVGTAANIYNWMLDNGYASIPEASEEASEFDNPASVADMVREAKQLENDYNNNHTSMADLVKNAKSMIPTDDRTMAERVIDGRLTEYFYGDKQNQTKNTNKIDYSKEDMSKESEVVIDRTSLLDDGTFIDKNKLYRNTYGSGDDFDWFGLSDYSNAQSRQPIVINKYNVTTSKQSQTERLNMILNNTYNVRSERIEELLEQILEIIDDKDDKPKSSSRPGTTGTTPNLFDDSSIPRQVQKLYN